MYACYVLLLKPSFVHSKCYTSQIVHSLSTEISYLVVSYNFKYFSTHFSTLLTPLGYSNKA